MAELVKPWKDGGSLTVTYTGDGDGSAVFTSDANEGIDREMTVAFVGAGQTIERLVKQEGLREPIVTSDNLMFCDKDGIPFAVLKEAAPYTKMEYLQSDGKSWIDTGVGFDYNQDVELIAEAMALSEGRTIIMGCYYSGSYRCIAIEFGGTSNSHKGAGRGYVLMKSSKALDLWSANSDINIKRSISLSYNATTRKSILKFDDAEISGTATAGTMSANSNIRMFLDARPSNASIIQYPLRIYSAQIKVGGELIRDFIPVLDESGTACMYDKVSREYFYNKGTGNFKAE